MEKVCVIERVEARVVRMLLASWVVRALRARRFYQGGEGISIVLSLMGISWGLNRERDLGILHEFLLPLLHHSDGDNLVTICLLRR